MTKLIMMNYLKKYLFLGLFSSIVFGFSQCGTSNKMLEKNAPSEIIDCYFERWSAGIKTGGAGIYIYISLKNVDIELDSVYFRDRVTHLKRNSRNNDVFIGNIITHRKQEIGVMVGEENIDKKYKEAVVEKDKIPFELGAYDCVVSYKEKGKIKYFKIENIKEKQKIPAPMTPNN